MGEDLSDHELESERLASLALGLLPFSPATTHRLLAHFGSVEEVLRAVCSTRVLGEALGPAGGGPDLPGEREDVTRPPGAFVSAASARDETESAPRAASDSNLRLFGSKSGSHPSPGRTTPPGALSSRGPFDAKAGPDFRPDRMPGRHRFGGTGMLDAHAGSRLGVAGLLELARRERERALAHDIRTLALCDAEYPALLRHIPDPPLILYVWGTLEPDDEVRISVVGARAATRHGLAAAERLGRSIASMGIAIVSGLARGIDSAAHRGALAACGRTIAVLGSGLLQIYPPENRALAERIAACGAVVSEYPLGTRPRPGFFPRRNRIISGLSAGTIVVEAGATSGALATAQFALDQGRELFVVPGSILEDSCAGSNGLLAGGIGHFVIGPEQVLRELSPPLREKLGLPPAAHEEEHAPRRRPRCGTDALPFEGASRGPGGPDIPRRDQVAGAECPDPSPSEETAVEPSRTALLGVLGPDARAVYARLTFEDPAPFEELLEGSGLTAARLSAALSALELLGLAEVLPGGRIARSSPRAV